MAHFLILLNGVKMSQVINMVLKNVDKCIVSMVCFIGFVQHTGAPDSQIFSLSL